MNISMQHDEYAEANLQRALAEADGVAEQGIDVIRRDGLIVVTGEVESPARRDAILRRVSEAFPGKQVRCEVALIPVGKPSDAEDVS